MHRDSEGFYRSIIDKEKCKGAGVRLKVSPGYFVDFDRVNMFVFGKISEDVFSGNYIMRAHYYEAMV